MSNEIRNIIYKKSEKKEKIYVKHKENEIMSEQPKEDEIMSEKLKEKKMIDEKPIESEIMSEKSKEEEKISEKSKENETMLEKHKEGETMPETQKEGEAISEKPKENESIPEKSKENKTTSEMPKEGESNSGKHKESETMPENPKENERISEKPKECESNYEKPKESETMHENLKGDEKIEENPDMSESVSQKPDISEITSEKPATSVAENAPEQHFKLYKRRYLILIILSLALFASGEAWMTYGSVTTQAMIYYNTSEQNINWFGNVFLLAFAVEAIPCTFMPQIIGVKWTLTIGCALNFGGVIIRLISHVIPIPKLRYDFLIAMLGNVLFGFGQGFLLNIPAMVSSRWFGEKERSISTAVAYMSNAIGVGIGFLDIFLVVGVKNTVEEIGKSFLIIVSAETCLSTIVLIVALIVLRERPESPPSKSEVMVGTLAQSNERFSTRIKNALKNMGAIIKKPDSGALLFVFATYYGNYTAIFIFLSSLILTVSNDPSISGYAGALGVILGGVLTTILGIIMGRTKNKFNRKIGIGIQFACAIPLIIILILYILNKLPVAVVFVFIVIFLTFCSPFISIGAELLAESTFPVDPNISTNEALIFGNIVGVIMTYLIGLIPGVAKEYTILGVAIGFYIINTIILIVIRVEGNRKDIPIINNNAE